MKSLAQPATPRFRNAEIGPKARASRPKGYWDRLSVGGRVQRSWLRLFLAGVVLGGAGVAYLVFSGLGERLLHREIEIQLGRLLAGPVSIDEVEVRFAGGFRVEAHGLEAYPSPDPNVPPALRASRVVAWIDLLALLVGRLELSTLILDGPHLRVVQQADGSFPALPFKGAIAPANHKPALSSAERFAVRLESLNPAASAFIEGFRAADRIEIQNGTLIWIDRGRHTEPGVPQERRLELVSGIAERNWLSGEVALTARAVFVDGEHAPFPIELEVRGRGGSHLEWTANLSQIPLEAARTPLSLIEPIEALAGTLNAKLRLTTTDAGESRLTFEGIIEGATLSLRRSKTIIAQERVELRAEFTLGERQLKITHGHLNGLRLGVDFNSTIERPLDFDSRVQIELRMVGARIHGIRDLATQFSEQSEMALAISRFTRPIESGRIRYIEASGTARFGHWQDLANGRTRILPDGFLIGAAVEAITIGTGSTDAIENLEGEFEWVEDQITLRNMNAIYRGNRLPEMNTVIVGISHLIRTSSSARAITRDPPAIPGVSPLLRIFRPRHPDELPPVKAIALAIDRLDHPLLRWPLRNVRLLIEPFRRGMQLTVRDGTWGGAAVRGEVSWFNDPERPRIQARLVLGPPPEADSDDDAGSRSENPVADSRGDELDGDRWGSGRFELEFRPRPYLPFRTAVGYFRLEDTNLLGNEIEIEIEPKGQAALRTTLDLADPDSVGLDISFAITGASFDGMSEFVVLPPGLVRGDVRATGSLAGRVRPDTSFIAELDGRVRIEAKDGAIKTDVPLLLRLGKASEGYNPFSKADRLRYESMTGTIDLTHGLLTIEDFEIEGPLRVFANARLDTNSRPAEIRAVVGIFLFRTSGELLDNLPLVRSFLPGSERGLIGAYFEVEGPVNAPEVEALPLQTLMSSVPSAIKAPFKVMQFLFGLTERDK